MSPTTSSTRTPASLACSTNGAAWSPSEPLPGPTSTASTISVDSSLDEVELVAVEPPGRRLAAVAHLGIGDRHDALGGDAPADPGLPGLGVDLHVLVHDGPEHRRSPGRLGAVGHRGEQAAGGLHHPAELGAADAGVPPVDVGLG